MIKLLALYKRWISPALGPRCRYYPSCSSYAQQAIERFGLISGGWMTLTRLLRCSPLSKGGYDPVPERFHWWRGPAVEPTDTTCVECHPEPGSSDDQRHPTQ